MDRNVWKYFIRFVIFVPIIFVVGIYVFFQMSPFYNRLKVDVALAEFGSIEEVIEVNAVVVRQENSFQLQSDGQIRWIVQEGQRVSNNQKLADILISDQDHSLLLQQQLINMRLETIAGGGDLSNFSLEAMKEIDQQMQYLLSDISHNIKNSQYELAFQNQQLLSEMADQKQLVSVHQQLPEMSVEELEDQKKLIDEKLNDVTHEIRANEAGYIAMGSDGLEGILTINPEGENMNNYFSHIDDVLSTGEPRKRDRYYRIIKDHRWYSLIPLQKNIGQLYDVGEKIIVREPSSNKEILGIVINHFDSYNDEEVLLMIELDQQLEEWHNKRIYQFAIVHQRQAGLLVPVSAVITEKNGSKSVLKIDVNGYAIKRQINELAHNETTAVLKEGTITIPSHESEGDEIQIQTINQYDEIISNPDSVTEGQKVR